MSGMQTFDGLAAVRCGLTEWEGRQVIVLYLVPLRTIAGWSESSQPPAEPNAGCEAIGDMKVMAKTQSAT